MAPLPALPGAALAAGAIETTEATHYGRPEKHGGKPTNDSPRLRPTLRLSIPLEGLVYAPSSRSLLLVRVPINLKCVAMSLK